LRVQNSEFTGQQNDGLQIDGGQGWIIAGNWFHDMVLNTGHNDGVQVYDCTGITVDRNKFSYSSTAGEDTNNTAVLVGDSAAVDDDRIRQPRALRLNPIPRRPPPLPATPQSSPSGMDAGV